MLIRLLRPPLLILLITVSVNTSTVARYYAQSISGHLELLHKRVPIAELLARHDTPEELRHRLETVLELRRFARDELALPDNDSYLSYSDIGREYVVWNIIATPKFALTPIRWCYPVTGCFSYRGYFSEKNARAYAEKLRQRGLDVVIRGVTAYSTLGWFADPVLNTMLRRDDSRLVKLLLHELAHQKLHIESDTAFNEAFANTVAREGLARWLVKSEFDSSKIDFELQQSREQDFVALIGQTRAELKTLYASSVSKSQKRQRKREIFEELKEQYKAWKERWNGYSGYDTFVLKDMNNAKIASLMTYHNLEHAFEAVLSYVDGDLAKFYKVAANLGSLSRVERATCLDALSQGNDASIPACLTL